MRNFYLLFFALCYAGLSAQIVNIPDPAFKQLLLEHFDYDDDGEIMSPDETFCQCFIDVDNAAITDLTGISAFFVSEWHISNTSITSIDSDNSQAGDGYYNLNFILTDNPLLQTADFSQSSFLSLQIWGSPLMTTLNLNPAKIQSLDLNNTGLSALDLTGFPHLMDLSCVNNTQLTSVVVQTPTMATFECNYNPNLESLSIMNTAVSMLNCHHNKLHTLTANKAETINANDNELVELNIAQDYYLSALYLDVSNNNLTHLDLSQAGTLFLLDASNNQLESINLKNGRDEYPWSWDVSGNPDFKYLCIDANELEGFVNLTNGDCMVNTYCSFTPGGEYNTIAGSFTFDGSNDGCDASDAHFSNVKLQVANGTSAEDVFTNNSGEFGFFVNTGNYTLSPVLENPEYFTVSPNSATVSFTNVNNVSDHDFCVTANGNHPDLEVTAYGNTLEPGFDTYRTIIIKNKGNQVLSGTATLSFDDTRLDYVSAAPVYSNLAMGSISWDYADLQPFESRHYTAVLNVNSPMETPAVNIGDVFEFNVASAIANDETPSDNTFTYTETAVGSFDPNDKTCLEGAAVSPEKIGEYLHYLIRFENTGTAAAHNIVVKDVIDATKFDVSSLQVLDNSHAVDTRINGQNVEFIFEGIELGAEADGYVLFKIRTLPTLTEGTTVSNKADIFFDYNFPVETNDAETTFQALSTDNFNVASVALYPNPTKNEFTVKSTSDLKSVQIFDVQGRLLETHVGTSPEMQIGLHSKSEGVYFVKAISEKGSAVVKIVKE